MAKVVYTSDAQVFTWRHVLPWKIVADLMRHRHLIATMTARDFRATYQASHFGLAWQLILPLIMLAVFYLVFGRILGGRFSNTATEAPVDYALALFVGLGIFTFVSQNIGNAPSLVTANVSYVKTLAFPLELLSITSVLTSGLTLVISLGLAAIVMALAKGYLHWSAACLPIYVACAFLLALGLSWGLSAIAVFIRDVAAILPPVTLILMFMCPIFYPASMVPKQIKWVVDLNPLAVIIEDARACLLYGVWPTPLSVGVLFLVSLAVAVLGYFIFMRSKAAFADVL